MTETTLPPARHFAFSGKERDRRWSHVRTEMAASGIDALVVCGFHGCWRHASANLQYLTDADAEGYLLFPLDADPVLYTFDDDPPTAHTPTSWVTDWRSGFGTGFAASIVRDLPQLGLEGARLATVGAGGAWSEYGGFPQRTHSALQEAVGRPLDDASDMLERMRLTKSAEEVTCLELGCAIGISAIESVAGLAAPGITDSEILRTLNDALVRGGGEPGSMILFHQGARGFMHGGIGRWYDVGADVPLAEGDVILIEFDASLRGYKAQFNQAFSIGVVGPEWRRIFDAIDASLQIGHDLVAPGLTAGELEQAMRGPFDEADLVHGLPFFHGLGLSIESPFSSAPAMQAAGDPSAVIGADWVLEFEPHAMTPDRQYGASLGAPALIGADGPRWLSGRRPRVLAL